MKTRNRIRRFDFVALAICFGLAATVGEEFATAANLTVTTTNDSGAGSLRQTIQDATDGDTIGFSITGIITLINGQLLITNGLSIVGPGATNLAVSGHTSSRIFQIGSNVTVSISGLTVRDGYVSGGTNSLKGGGIYNAGSLSLLQCILATNHAFGSAGSNGVFAGRGADGCGGGIFNCGRLEVTQCVFARNTAIGGSGLNALDSQFNRSGAGGTGLGGALYNDGTLSIAWSTLSDNAASGGTGGAGGFSFSPGGAGGDAEGGGVCNRGSASLVFNTFSDNAATGGAGGSFFGFQDIDGEPGGPGGFGYGGGIHDSNGVVTLTNNTLAGNLAAGGNGGAGSLGAFTVCGAFPPGSGGNGGNGGNGSGGAIYSFSGAVQLQSSTLSRNRATGGLGGPGGSAGLCMPPVFPPQPPIYGASGRPGSAGAGLSGGLMLNSSTNSLQNTIIAVNVASIGSDVTGSIASQGHNLIGITNDSTGWLTSDLAGNITRPLDPRLGSLQNNGGPTFTMALLTGSPAIDQGRSDGLIADQRGRSRPIDRGAVTNAPEGDASDIGAYEMQREEFSLVRLERNSGNVVLHFDTEVGLSYRIERSDVLWAEIWSVVADNLPGNGSTVQVIDLGGAGQAQRFYRGRTMP